MSYFGSIDDILPAFTKARDNTLWAIVKKKGGQMPNSGLRHQRLRRHLAKELVAIGAVGFRSQHVHPPHPVDVQRRRTHGICAMLRHER